MKFEEKLQSLRKKSNLSQEALADKLGVSRQAVSKWESGTSYPEMDKLIMMSKLFKCSLDDLVNDQVKDKDVLEREANRRVGYFNDFINSIAKSIKMFSSMKVISIIKCLFELFFFGLFLFCVSAVINAVLISIVEWATAYCDDPIYFFVILFYLIFMIILVITDIIVFVLFYKVRYLDYYNQVSYSISQAEEIKGDIPDNNKRIKLNSKAPKIILKNQKEKQVSTLNVLYDIIKSLGKALLTFLGSYIFLFMIFIIICLTISIYLISINNIFIGISLCILCITIISTYIFILLARCIVDKKNKMMPFIITLIVSICVFSFGFTYTLISFKDIDIIENEYITKEIKLDYKDDLIINSSSIEYKVDDREDIAISVKYIDTFNYYNYDVENNVHSIFIGNLDENPFKMINEFLDNLKHDRIVSYSSSDYLIEVKANKNNINKLIQNASKYRKVEDYEEFSNTTYVQYGRYLHSNTYCDLNKAGFYNCYDVINESQCDVKVINGKILADDSSKCRCYYGDDYDYLCYDKQE